MVGRGERSGVARYPTLCDRAAKDGPPELSDLKENRSLRFGRDERFVGGGGERFSLDESAEDGAGEFQGASVDDVGGPVLKVGTGGLFGRGRREMEGRNNYFVAAEEEEC